MAVSDPLGLVADVVRRAERAGAAEAEAFYDQRETTGLEVRDQQVEALTSASTRGLGLRVLLADGASAYVYTPELGTRALGELARRAVALARQAAPDPDRGLPAEVPAQVDEDLAIFDPTLAEVSTERKIELLRQVERVARAEDRRVESTEVARYRDALGTVALANSRGFGGTYRWSSAYATLVAIARADGQALRGYSYSTGHGFEDLDPVLVGRQAARRAVKPLGGKPVPTQKATVIFEPEVAAELLTQLAQALSGEAVLKGRSMFAGRLGQRVGSPLVTLVDQGNLPGGLGSAPFDGEGVPSGRTVLIDGGLLTGYLHNGYTARRMGARSTGNGVRQNYRLAAEVGPTNFGLATGQIGREALISQVQRGLLVLATRNVGGINPVNGDYSVGAAGVWLEDGQETGPVAGVTIAANMLEMLAGLTAVADDLRWMPGSGAIGSGTVRIEGMTIAGA
jgi:PmbA protein